jgi:uncharacterized protein YfbU (UPF0304 family)
VTNEEMWRMKDQTCRAVIYITSGYHVILTMQKLNRMSSNEIEVLNRKEFEASIQNECKELLKYLVKNKSEVGNWNRNFNLLDKWIETYYSKE